MKTTALVQGAPCFYCGLEIDYGQEVYENDGAYAHPECYEGTQREIEEAIVRTQDDADDEYDAYEEDRLIEASYMPEENGEQDTDGPDGGDDD